ncbi:integrin beta-PS isoform X2 [Aethina tumida]|uniref:integrin beta-PS isoform X2 n=1 Tax=Aethina tumida TaxID=116153 RepID=UPI0021483F20|nr:integrin beta-PS isoform X2 [Aethina tumida]
MDSTNSITRTVFLLTALTTIVIAQISQPQQNPCTSKLTCHDCIQTPSCAWCYAPNIKESPRCFQPNSPIPPKEECPEEFIYNPDNLMSIVTNYELSKAHSKGGEGGGNWMSGIEGSWNYSEHTSSSGSASGGWGGGVGGGGMGAGQIVQVAPQRMNLKLRAKQTHSIHMAYTQAEDYPVDLYYLMDLSRSMYDDKEKLSLLGDKLASTMQKITTKFSLGFGSFVDKVKMPYVSTLKEKLLKPCDDCAEPYGYHHHMSLSTNTDKFSHMVKQASVSGNLDAPEGGFDAIMQAVVCRNEIGWREQARRLLVFSTDASFHYAGDGKLGGIVKPNDGLCHLDSNGYYYESSNQDYPSIEQINMVVKKNAINVIFAVTNQTIAVYKTLAEHIDGATYASINEDSSNIVEIIEEEYNKISSSVEMKHNASSHLKLKFFTKCLDASGKLVNTNKCGNIKVGDLITFRIDIEVIECPKDPKDWTQTIQIYPIGINESLTIDLEMLCSCDCERPGHPSFKFNAPECNNHGTYMCGICDCVEGAFGRNCECTPDSFADLENKTTSCIHPNSTSQIECSGRGQCSCGRCECHPRQHENEHVYGDYCECDDFSCERHNGKLCSGPDHGICDCGKCRCQEGWDGPNCACQKSNATCYLPGVENGEICSGHGVCECGVCKCESTEDGRYSGKFCEKCPTCSDRCEEFRDCVQCQQYKTGPLKDPDDCAANCTKFVPIPVTEVKVPSEEEGNEIFCAYFDEDECRFSYVYYFDKDNKIQVRAQEERECQAKVYVPGIVLGVIAAIVLIGMAVLLLWKLFTTIHDRREFARFEKERMMAKWDTGENPIYKQATSTFKNPTYAGKS